MNTTKKYDYVRDLSWKDYKDWEGRMMMWTIFVGEWNRVAVQYMRDTLRLTEWAWELHALTGLEDYG